MGKGLYKLRNKHGKILQKKFNITRLKVHKTRLVEEEEDTSTLYDLAYLTYIPKTLFLLLLLQLAIVPNWTLHLFMYGLSIFGFSTLGFQPLDSQPLDSPPLDSQPLDSPPLDSQP